MTRTSRDTLAQLGLVALFPVMMLGTAALNAKSLPEAIVTEAGIESAIVAEPGAIRDGLPVKVTLARYTITTGKWVTVLGKPITTFCKGAVFPSHQIRCRDTASPFDLKSVGKAQPISLGPWYTNLD